ncbi:uncharacterized protein LOC134190252 [Corticium candelabrum]|uniref:uncharacterized protein LOC134190252 n=1 Tax=Corticium candelabrum TaxID=121492 RepID=UPI002E26829B|nr:uncharacterized protein LOC134190252 [Corticium candelabrum]
MATVSCPAPKNCKYEGPFRRVSAHFHSSHDASECSTHFVRENNLVQRPTCHQWFTRLNQHVSKCNTSLILSSSSSTVKRATPTQRDSNVDVDDRFRASQSSVCSAQPPEINEKESNAQQEAWRWLDSISIDAILQSLTVHSVQYVPPALRSTFYDCCLIPLRKIEEEPEYEGGWELLLLLPRMILKPHPKGKSSLRDVKAIHQRFLHFHWKELVNLQSSNKESRKVDALSKQNQEERYRAALKSVKCAELSRAARILTRDGLIPPSPETEEKLKDKHPSQSEELRLSTVNTPQIDLKRSVFLEALRRAPRGRVLVLRAGGMSIYVYCWKTFSPVISCLELVATLRNVSYLPT